MTIAVDMGCEATKKKKKKLSVYFKGQFKAPRETKVKLLNHLSIFSSHIWSGHLYQKSQLLCIFKEWAGSIQVLSMYFPLIGTEYILDLYLFIAYFKQTPVLSLSLALPGLVVQSIGCSLQI